MKPANYPLTIYGGTTFDKSCLLFTYKVSGVPVDITGFTVRAICRSHNGTAAFEWSTETGTLVTDPVAGQIWPDVSAEQTQALETFAGPVARHDNGFAVHTLGVYTLETVSPSGRVVRLLQGAVYIAKGLRNG
ncbi:hypothetical protein [Curvibacter phage PCA1]|nr:hypothetical protein [Curvibacter phage PCA1]